MGGLGSGTFPRLAARQITGELLSLDIRGLNRKGLLAPQISGASKWFNGTKEVGSIGFKVQGSGGRTTGVRLEYRHYGETFAYTVLVTWTPCHFGGHRPWWICPGRGCGRRVANLYYERFFLCRHCHDLAYESTREPAFIRCLKRSQEIRLKLGGSGNIYEQFPPRPKGMHLRTYRRFQSKAFDAEIAHWQGYSEWLASFASRIPKSTS